MNIIKKTENRFNIVTVFALTFSLILCFLADGFAAADEVKDSCLRLHILAASDSEEDQRVKLLVRDALLEKGADIFTGNASAEEAAIQIEKNKEILEETADRILEENGMDYKSSISITDEYFDTRQYDGITLPAGIYKACKVILGEGKGHNWWCIMFPPLCLPAATKAEDEAYAVFGENGGNLVTGKDGYVIKFRIVEIAGQVIDAIKNRISEK